MDRSCTDIHHGIISLAAPRTLASRSGNPSERGCPTGRLRRRKPVPFVITSAGGGQRASRFQDTAGLWFLAWNASVSGPSPISTGQRRPFTGNRDLPTAGRFHTFLRRAIFSDYTESWANGPIDRGDRS